MVRRAALGVVAAIGTIALFGARAGAETKMFSGPPGSSWFVDGNWTPSGVPASGDTVTVNAGTVDLAGGSPTIAGLTLSGGTITGIGGDLTVNGLITWSGGGFSGTGTIFAENGVNLTGSPTLDTRTFRLDGGTGTLSGAVTKFVMSNNAVFDNHATFAVTGDGGAMGGEQGFGGSGVFINRGTFQKIAPANTGETEFFNVGFNNSGGTVQVEHGTLKLSGGGSSASGMFIVTAPGGIDFNNGGFSFDAASSISGSGTIELSANATVASPFNVTGTTSIAGGFVQFTGAVASVGALSVSFGTAAFNSTVTTITPTALTIASTGTLDGSNAFVVNSQIEWSGGTIAGTGSFTANAGIDMDGSTKFLNGRTVTVTAGPISFAGGTNTLQMSNGAVFDLGAAVTLEFDDDGGFSAQGFFGEGTIKNAGVFRKIGGTGTTNVEVRLENTGTVENDASGSTLRLAGGSSNKGTYLAAAGATLALDGGDHEIESGASLIGAGTVRFDSGATSVAGTYNVTGTTKVDGGLVNFDGIVNNVGALVISNGLADFSSTSSPIALPSLMLSAGVLTGSDTITVTGPFSWTGGRIEGTSDPNSIINAGAGLTLGGGTKRLDNRTLRVTGGTATMDGTLNIIEMHDEALFINQATFLFQNDGGDDVQGFTGDGTFNNQGLLSKTVTGNTGASRFTGVAFNNSGTVEVLAGSLHFTAGYKQTAGVTRLSGGTITAMPQLEIQGGALEGIGTLSADVLNGGEIRPGTPAGVPGLLTIAGSLTQTPSGKVVIEIGGLNPPQFDRLAVVDAAELGGTLDVRLINQFVPLLGNIFPVITYNGRSGDFSHIDVPAIGAGLTLAVTAGTDEVAVEVVQGQPSPGATATITATAPPTSTPSMSATATASRTTTSTLTPGVTSSPTPSLTATNSPPPSATPSATASATLAATATASPSASPSHTPTAGPSSSPSVSPTSSPTGAATNTPTASPSQTPTQTPSAPSGTPTLTATAIATASATPTTSSGPSVTPSVTPSSTASVPPSQTPTLTPTGPTSTPTPTSTPSLTAPPTDSPTITPTSSPNDTPTASPSATATASASASATASATPPATATATVAPTAPSTATATATASATETTMPTATPTIPSTPTATATTPPSTATPSATATTASGSATIVVGSGAGLPGGSVSIQVVLNTDTDIALTQNDILFGPEVFPAIGANNRPLCAVNPDIQKGAAFTFLPQGCTPGVDCSGLRVVVSDLPAVSPIPSGSVLYACTFSVAASAPPGDYPLTCDNAVAQDPNGDAVQTTCDDGVVTVMGGAPTPTSTPLPATVTATVPPPSTPTRTSATPHASPDDDGCQVAEQASGGSAWLLTLPVFWLAWRRRRRNPR